MKNAIEIHNLEKSYKKLKVLTGIDLTVPEGKVVALLGPNGAGKTTTIKILSTLILPDKGEVKVGGFDVITEADEVRSIIGLTGQYSAVDEYLTGRENLVMMGQLYHLSVRDAKSRTEELLKHFDLLEAANRPVKTYSGGMIRKLDLAASLIATPPILFLDEPTTGLDPRSRNAMWETIKELVKSDTTILLTTQNLEEADILSDRIVLIDRGIVIAEGTADELKSKIGSERLVFTFQDDKDFQKASKVITGQSIQIDKEVKLVSIALDGKVRDIRRVLQTIENAGIQIESMALHKPTLDDVFLQLTGHEAEEKNEKEKGVVNG